MTSEFEESTASTRSATARKRSAAPKPSDLQDESREPPEDGFWKRAAGRAVAQSLRSAAFYQLYAVFSSVCVSSYFIFFVVFRLRVAFFLRFLLVISAPGYFCLLAVVNCVVLITLFTTRHNLNRLEETLANVADAVTAPVLQVLPSFAQTMSLDELRKRLLASARIVKHKEAPLSEMSLLGIAGAPITISSRLVLNAAIRAVLFVVEARYGSALQAGERMLNIATVKRILSGELVSLLFSPFSATIHLYIIIAVAETFVLTMLPFAIASVFSKRPL
jgi:hypothetical protein